MVAEISVKGERLGNYFITATCSSWLRQALWLQHFDILSLIFQKPGPGLIGISIFTLRYPAHKSVSSTLSPNTPQPYALCMQSGLKYEYRSAFQFISKVMDLVLSDQASQFTRCALFGRFTEVCCACNVPWKQVESFSGEPSPKLQAGQRLRWLLCWEGPYA